MMFSGGKAIRRATLTDDQLSLLLELVSLGGFEPVRLEQGEMKRKYNDCDDFYTVNRNLFYKVILEHGESEEATGWLETIFSKALEILSWGWSEGNFYEKVQKEILEGIPLDPIRLTKENEFMRQYPPKSYFSGHTRDENSIGSTAGVHTYCHGFIDMKRTSITHNALHCRACGLRVTFPVDVKTYGELRKYIAEQLKYLTV